VGDVAEAGINDGLDIPADDVWYTSLTFAKPLDVVNGKPVWSPSEVRYALGGRDGTDLIRATAESKKVVARDIGGFRVRRFSENPAIMEFELVIRQEGAQDHLSAGRVRIKITLRN
jgi:hypothetical protein